MCSQQQISFQTPMFSFMLLIREKVGYTIFFKKIHRTRRFSCETVQENQMVKSHKNIFHISDFPSSLYIFVCLEKQHLTEIINVQRIHEHCVSVFCYFLFYCNYTKVFVSS